MTTAAVVLLLGAIAVFRTSPISCAPCCTLTWTTYPNQHVPYMVQILSVGEITGDNNIVSEDACKEACVSDSSCSSIDWNFHDNTCFFGYAHSPSPRYPDTGVNHHDLARDCPVVAQPVAPAGSYQNDPTEAPAPTDPPGF